MQHNNNTYPFYGPEDIKRYLSGSMSAQEMHDMEKAALKDPMLADAIDGFRDADPVVTDTHLNAVKASILGLSQQEPVVIPLHTTPKTHWWRWAAAACSLTLIAGAAWWVTQRTEPGNNPVAIIDKMQPPDTSRTLVSPPSPTTPREATDPGDQATTLSQNKNQPDLQAKVKKEQLLSSKTVTSAKALQQPSVVQEMTADEAVQPQARLNFELRAHKDEQANAVYGYAPQANAAPADHIAKNAYMSAPAKAMAFQPVAYIQGQVVDKEGAPLPNASISIPGRSKTTANNDGSFVLPVYDSNFNALIGSSGYRDAKAFLQPGKENKVILDKVFDHPEEVVVTAMGKNRKKTAAYMEDARKAQAAATSANEIIYPEEGWGNFYDELSSSLGVNKAKTTKTLQIKFTVDDNGDPVDFEIVESPDAVLAKKAIEFIKKAKWKNFKLDKNALVKIEVN